MQASKLAAARTRTRMPDLAGRKRPPVSRKTTSWGQAPTPQPQNHSLNLSCPTRGPITFMGASSDSGLKDRSAGRGVVVAVKPQSSINAVVAVSLKKKSHGMTWLSAMIA
jgi:hypothetical protein